MRRGGPLRRLTGLRNKTPLKAGGALKPGTKGLERSELVAKRPVRTSEERKARAVVWERAQARCERCGRADATEWSHRRARSQGGAWSATNGLAMCHTCHQECHLNPAVAYQQGWHVRSTQNPALVPVWVAGQGLVYLTEAGTYRPVTPTKRSA
jgi:hypothetical protein